MDLAGVLSRKYYTHFAPTKSAEAMRRAGCHLFCCEDMVIVGKLGNGYFASVFLVHHRPTDQFMAMKLTKEASAHRHEIELLNKLNHKNVVKLFGSCVIGARFACLTELANGGNLSSLLSARHVNLSWSVRVGLALDIANGLQHLHHHNLIHRDLSSANILIQINFPDSPPSSTRKMACSSSSLMSSPPHHIPFDLISSPSPTLSHVMTSPDLYTRHKRTVFNLMGDVADSLDGTLLNGNSTALDDDLPFTPSRAVATPAVLPIWQQPIWTSLCSESSSPRYTAVIADLGLCLDLDRLPSEPMSLVGNPYYIAPECLTDTAPYTFAADVFAYGLLVCELITRLLNDGTQIPRTQDFGLDHAELPVPEDCPEWFSQVAMDACKVDHKKRPKLSTLIHRISTEAISVDNPTTISPKS